MTRSELLFLISQDGLMDVLENLDPSEIEDDQIHEEWVLAAAHLNSLKQVLGIY